MSEENDPPPDQIQGSYSPGIARRQLRQLRRSVSNPALLPSASSSISSHGPADLPPLIGAPGDPFISRYSNEKLLTIGTSSPGFGSPALTRHGRQLKPLSRQESEPILGSRFAELKVRPSPPDGLHYESSRSTGTVSSGCNSPRLMRTNMSLSGSMENSPATVRRIFPAKYQVTTTTSCMSPMSPRRIPSNFEGPSFIMPPSPSSTTSAPNSPFVNKRGGSVMLRRPAGGGSRSNTPDANRYPLPANMNISDLSPRNGFPPQIDANIANIIAEASALQHLQDDYLNHNGPVDDETGEPVINVVARTRHHSGGHGETSPTHGFEDDFIANQSGDTLYDIQETRDEVPVDEAVENSSETTQESNNEKSSREHMSEEKVDKSVPEYQKSPLSTNNRVTKWLMGLEPSNEENCNTDLPRAEHILPDINLHT